MGRLVTKVLVSVSRLCRLARFGLAIITPSRGIESPVPTGVHTLAWTAGDECCQNPRKKNLVAFGVDETNFSVPVKGLSTHVLHAHTHMRARTHSHTHAQTHTHTHTQTHTCAHTHTRINTHTHTHTHSLTLIMFGLEMTPILFRMTRCVYLRTHKRTHKNTHILIGHISIIRMWNRFSNVFSINFF